MKKYTKTLNSLEGFKQTAILNFGDKYQKDEIKSLT